MEVTNEQLRVEFSQRLKAEVEGIRLPVSSPTQISRVFNQRFPRQTVTPQTVRKWLLAEAMPTQPKLLALAEWFGVSAQWLRFGTGVREASLPAGPAHSAQPSGLMVLGNEYASLIPLVESLARLPSRDLDLVKGIVGLMLAEPR